MKMNRLVLVLLALALAVPLSAQSVVFSDPLVSANGNWAVNPVNQGGGALDYVAGHLGYLVATPTADDAAFRSLTAFQTQAYFSWSAQVDVHLTAGLTSHQYANLNLIVGKAADPWTNQAVLAIDRYHDGTALVQGFDSYITTAGTETPLSPIANSTTDATLLIAYDVTTGMLTYAYDADGVANPGVSFTTAHSVDISGWSMAPTDAFVFLLVGGSGGAVSGPTIAAADAYFSNFVVTSGVAVPEPSTVALLAGCAVLGVVVWWRRRAA